MYNDTDERITVPGIVIHAGFLLKLSITRKNVTSAVIGMAAGQTAP
jgi:hypothetical protein